MKHLVSLLIIACSILMSGAMTPDARRSFKALESRAASGDPKAMFNLARTLEVGYDSIAVDTVRALSLYRAAANANYPAAQNYLGFLLFEGKYVNADKDSALFYIRAAADAGDLTAAHNVAYLSISNNLPSASADLIYLKRAADAGLPQSMTMLANLYVEGDLLPKDSLKAIDLYEKSIEKGFPDAELRLLNLMGPKWISYNSEQSLIEAKKYWKLGAYSIAFGFLGQVEADSQQAPQAYTLLGFAYSREFGVKYDYHLANIYFTMAAMMNNPSACFILAETLEIFPDILNDILPDIRKDYNYFTVDKIEQFKTVTAEELRHKAAAAGITTPRRALLSLFE